MASLPAFVNARNLYQIFLHIAVVALALEVFFLSSERSSREMPNAKPGDFFYLSDTYPIDTRMDTDTLSPLLIFVFTTSCPFCEKNIAIWNPIDSLARRNNVHTLGIALDSDSSARRYAAINKLKYPVIVATHPAKYKELNHISGVPQTLLRSSDGKLKRVWLGLLKEDEKSTVVRSAIEEATNH